MFKRKKTKTELIDAQGVVKGIPVELIRYDEKTGEICVGDECFSIRYNPDKHEVAIEYNPDSPVCSPLMRKVAEKFMKNVMEGARVRFRKVKKVD